MAGSEAVDTADARETDDGDDDDDDCAFGGSGEVNAAMALCWKMDAPTSAGKE